MAYKVFTNGSVLNASEINENLMNQAVIVFSNSTARSAALTSPTEGMVTYLEDTNSFEFWNGTAYQAFGSSTGVAVDFLVVAGGGGGSMLSSGAGAGGGGAGGYRNNVSGELSGGSSTAEAALTVPKGTYPLRVGAGGAGAATNATAGGKGSPSQFFVIYSDGGGAGGTARAGAFQGGSSGGAWRDQNGTIPSITGQGTDGGTSASANSGAAGGGGAGVKGVNTSGINGTNGGAGLASSITGSSVTRAGGGGGGASSGSAGTGGTGGGGNGAVNTGAAGNGTANTGSGGGGSCQTPGSSGSGGSGIVVFRVPTGTSVSFSGGVTQTNSTISGKQVYVVTATSTTSETVTFA